MDDTTLELKDADAAREVAKAIDAIAADLLKHMQTYPAGHPVHDVPRIATAMEKSIKHGKLDDARKRAITLDQYIEQYAPTDPPAQEAKFTLRHRVRILAKTGE